MLELGALLIAGAILLLALLPPIFQRPRPPHWATWPLACELAAVLIVCLLALGLGCLLQGVIGIVQGGLGVADLALVLLIGVAASVALRRRRTRPLRREVAP